MAALGGTWLLTNLYSLQAMLAFAVLVTGGLIIKAYLATRRPRDFPPGPPGLPFLGNLASMPSSKSYLQFAEWARQYGPILGLKAGPLNLVVLSDPDDVHELFDKRGHQYAGRPYNYIALNHVYERDIGQILLFQRNDRLLKRWKRPAKWFLGAQGIEGLMPVLNAMSARCVRSLADDPPAFLEHLRVWALGTPVVALCGQSDVSPALLKTYFRRQNILTDLLEPGKTPPVDFVPPLRWLPAFMAPWKRNARFVRAHQDAFYGELVTKARERQQRGEEGHRHYNAVMVRLLNEGMPEREVKWLAGGLLDAAFDTASAAVRNFVVAMAGHGEVLKRAREEVERVCQGDRVPQGEDTTRMPYLRACMMEMFRWRPPAPLGLPHVLDTDDTYKGHFIPAGTNLLINAFGMLHDPRVHADPDVFDPQRYMDDPSAETDEKKRSTWVFGAGRRKCAGDQYMMQALMTGMAKMVWALDMALPQGTDLSVENGFDGGLMLKPCEDMVVRFTVREGRREALIQDWERWEGGLKELLGDV